MAKKDKGASPAEAAVETKAKKSKAPEAPEAKTKKGKSSASSSDFAKPSEAPSGEGWNLTEEAEGRLVLFTPLREDTVETSFGEKPIVVADVVVIDEKKPAKSEAHDDVYVFGGYLRGSLRGFINEKRVLGRLVKGEPKKKGENAPWLLEDATEAEIALAVAYLESVDPFAGGGKKAKK